MTVIATVSPFEALGSNLRFGATPDGTPFVVGSDFARVMDYRDADKAARLLDEDEKGTQIVGTPGGPQRMVVFYEDGIWELIFRSNKPEAKKLKKRVKQILAQLRRGELVAPSSVRPEEITRRDLALMVVAEADRADQEAARALVAEQRIAELEPKAKAADLLADSEGTLPMGAVANMFNIGRTTFFKLLRAEKILQPDRRPYQEYADWFRVVTGTYESSDGGRHVHYTSHLYPAGALRLHALLARRGHTLRRPEIDGQLRLIGGGAA